MSDRPVRPCDSCGGVDDHPRHVFATVQGEGDTPPEVLDKILENTKKADLPLVLQHLRDSSTVMKHMDCCREDGCPDGTCGVVTKGAEDLKGDALVKHLTSRGSDD